MVGNDGKARADDPGFDALARHVLARHQERRLDASADLHTLNLYHEAAHGLPFGQDGPHLRDGSDHPFAELPADCGGCGTVLTVGGNGEGHWNGGSYDCAPRR